MAIFHCQAKAISRATGRSATAAAAYRAGCRIEDTRTGEIHDYRNKKGATPHEIITADGTKIDRSELWNLAEAAEKRKDAKVAREWELALPEELSPEARTALALSFAKELADRYGVAADVCIHEPGKNGDSRNHHAHILTTTRTFSKGQLGEKTRILDRPMTSGKEVEKMREKWAELVNLSLEKAGLEARIDSRSLADQGIPRLPTVHVGPTATAMERKGKSTERGAINRTRIAQNQEIEELISLEIQTAGIEEAKAKAKAWREDQVRAKLEKERQAELEKQKEKERQEKEQALEKERKRALEKERTAKKQRLRGGWER